MGLPELKNKVLLQIENADEELLTKVFSIIENYKENKQTESNKSIVSEPTVAYDVLGKPLTLKQYNKGIDKGIDDIKKGRFISQEDLEKEIDGWYDE
jgi:predicted transcriptional regulator